MEIVLGKEIEGITTIDVVSNNLEDSEKLVEISEQMVKFCSDNGGVGLSAPQVGSSKKIIIWKNEEGNFSVGFNPVYFPAEKKVLNYVEQCLSYPEEYYRTKRYKYIIAIFYLPSKKTGELRKVNLKLKGEEALIFQHETDHLNGKTIKTIGKQFEFEEEENEEINA